MTETDRAYDVVVYGATGFTGKLVARYLAAHAPADVRWAVAGRNREALEAARRDLVAGAVCPPAGVVVASSTDDASLRAMAKQARVVLTTVGPYAGRGEGVVAACVEEGADYVDITGEPEFVDATLDRFDDAARARGVRVVSCCGFDSIPHDLGAYFTRKQLPAGAAADVRGYVRAAGAVSGGTWTSAVEGMGSFRAAARAAKARAARRRKASDGRRVERIKDGVHYRRDLGAWGVPLPTIDASVVLRSARADDAYGPTFRYGHYARVRHAYTIAAAGAGLGALFALSQLAPARKLLLGLHKPGAGPDEARRRKSFFVVTFVGEADGRTVTTKVSGGDPGYDETAKMIAESALCLARDRDRLPARAGVLTPASAMGDALLDRLVRAGIRFEVVASG